MDKQKIPVTPAAVLIDTVIAILGFLYIPDLEAFRFSSAFFPTVIFVFFVLLTLLGIQLYFYRKFVKSGHRVAQTEYLFTKKFMAATLVILAVYVVGLAWSISSEKTAIKSEYYNNQSVVVNGNDNYVNTGNR